MDIDGCSGQSVPNISLFDSYLLNTDNWVQTVLDFGTKYAVLVDKVIAQRVFCNYACCFTCLG